MLGCDALNKRIVLRGDERGMGGSKPGMLMKEEGRFLSDSLGLARKDPAARIGGQHDKLLERKLFVSV